MSESNIVHKTGLASLDRPYCELLPDDGYDVSFCAKTAYRMIKESPYYRPEAPALEYYGNVISASQMSAKIEEAAAAFYNLGIRKDDIVFMICLNTPEMVYSLYALNKIGAISEWFNPQGMTAELLHEIVTESGIKYIMTAEPLAALVGKGVKDTGIEKIIVLPLADSMSFSTRMGFLLSGKKGKIPKPDPDPRFLTWKSLIRNHRGSSDEDIEVPYEEGKTAVIVHTGGTTGPIKRVAMTDYNVNSHTYQTGMLPMDIKNTDSFLQLVPPMVAYSLDGLHLSNYYGMKTYLIAKYSRDDFVDTMLKTRANHYFTVPAFLKMLIDNPKIDGADLSFIKSVNHGGEAISKEDDRLIDEILAKHGCTVKTNPGYGQNEEFGAFTVNIETESEAKEYGSSGIPFPGNDCVILDSETHEELPYGKDENGKYRIGDIYVCGPTVMKGYIGRDEFRNADTFREISGKVYADTGDQGYLDDKGKLWFTTRKCRIIRRAGGCKVFSTVLEHVLEGMEEVEECCVVAAPDPVMEKMPCCHILLKKSYRELPEEEMKKVASSVIEKMEEQAAKMYTYYMPGAYEFRSESLPLTSFGKTDFRKLEQLNQELCADGSDLPKVRFS